MDDVYLYIWLCSCYVYTDDTYKLMYVELCYVIMGDVLLKSSEKPTCLIWTYGYICFTILCFYGQMPLWTICCGHRHMNFTMHSQKLHQFTVCVSIDNLIWRCWFFHSASDMILKAILYGILKTVIFIMFNILLILKLFVLKTWQDIWWRPDMIRNISCKTLILSS